MSRPKPYVLLEHITPEWKSIQICEADAVYAVCYQGRPIQVKTHADINSNYVRPKYAKTMYANSGHAFNMAERFNALFNTTDFSVVMMTAGRVLKEY